jgi:DNA-binding IclR family transcriptional regulator
MSLADLSRALGTPKSSLAALLRGLAEEQVIVASEGVYRLGPGAFGLGSALMEARRRFPQAELVREGMRRLAEASGETVLLAVADSDGETMTYVDLVESANVVRYTVAVGDRRALYATAGGRMLLSARDDAELAAYFARLKPAALSAATEVRTATLADLVALARAAGFAQTVDQAANGVTGTAALVRDAAGDVVGALVIAAPTDRSRDRRNELARMVVAEAQTISRSLGWR